MSHAEKRSVEARNAELQRSLQQCAEQKEALERQGERGRRALESRWASRGPGTERGASREPRLLGSPCAYRRTHGARNATAPLMCGG